MSGYFLYHSIGTYANKTQQLEAAAQRYAQMWSAANDGQWDYALAQVEEFKQAWATLLGTQKENVTFAENVTSGLYSILGALGSKTLQGKELLVGADCFPSLHFLLQKLADRFGFILRTVPLSAGLAYVSDDDFIQAWNDQVALALITWVSSTTSHRVDTARLVATAQKYNSLTVIDITQGAGVVPFQITAGMDFVLSASLKWVCGSTGACALYVNSERLEECEPEYRGWFSQDNPFNWDLTQFSYAPDARRFDHGTPSVLGAIMSLPGIKYVLEQGLETLFKHNRALTQQLLDWAEKNNQTVITPLACEQRGGSIMLRLDSAQQAAHYVDRLREQAIYIDARSAIIRISPGAISSAAKLEQLCDFLNSAT